MGAAEAYQITSRHADTKFVEVPHSRRWLDLQDFGWAELIDKLDKVRLLADPSQGYASQANAALNRRMDDIIISAARGNSRTNSGLSALPAGQKIAVGAANLTLAKLLTTKEILDANEVDDDGALGADGQGLDGFPGDRGQHQDADQPLRHHGNQGIDYNSVKALANGQIDTFLGFSSFAASVCQGRHGHDRLRAGLVALVRGAGCRPGNQHVCGPPAGQEQRLAGHGRYVHRCPRIEDEGVVDRLRLTRQPEGATPLVATGYSTELTTIIGPSYGLARPSA